MTTPTTDIFTLVLARTVTPSPGQAASLIHLSWIAPTQGNRLVQVYVDSQLTCITTSQRQRHALLLLERNTPRSIELLAVDAADPDAALTPQPEALATWSPPAASSIKTTLPHDSSLPDDASLRLELTSDVYNDATVISIHHPANDRAGFGRVFAIGAFGTDALPTDQTPDDLQHRSATLPAGQYTITAHAENRHAQPLTNPASQTITLQPRPLPAHTVVMDADFTLRWSAHEDEPAT